MRRFRRGYFGALLVVLGIAGCEFETSAPPAPQAQAQPVPATGFARVTTRPDAARREARDRERGGSACAR